MTPTSPVLVPSVDSSAGLKALPAVLSVIAGSADAIGVLGLGGLFVAHVTGNLVLLASHVVTGTPIKVAEALSVPVFILALGLTRSAAIRLEAIGRPSLRPLLVVQFLLLAGFLSVGVAAGPHLDPRAGQAVVAGMLGVCAMALQNALVQISVAGAPSTAVITANITRFVMDAGEALMGRDPSQVEEARRRAAHTWPAIVGFAAGAALGAAGFAAAGLTALALPTALAVLALALTPDRSGSKGGSMALRLPRAHGQGATLHGSLSSLAQDEGDDLLSHHANE